MTSQLETVFQMKNTERMNADEKGATYLRISDAIPSSDNSIALDGDGQ